MLRYDDEDSNLASTRIADLSGLCEIKLIELELQFRIRALAALAVTLGTEKSDRVDYSNRSREVCVRTCVYGVDNFRTNITVSISIIVA